MLEKILADMEKSVGSVRRCLELYLKAIGNLNNRNYAADVIKAQAEAIKAVNTAIGHLKALDAEMKKLAGTAAGRKEIADKLMKISNAQERLLLLLKRAEDILTEELVKST
jgi:hypothetical protein